MKRTALTPRRRKRERSGIRDDDGPLRCPAHLQWVRGHECALNDAICNGNIQAAHVRMGLAGGMGLKPPDDRVVPLCEHHHALQHSTGEDRFWQSVGIDPLKIAERLAAQSPPLRRMRKKDEDR